MAKIFNVYRIPPPPYNKLNSGTKKGVAKKAKMNLFDIEIFTSNCI